MSTDKRPDLRIGVNPAEVARQCAAHVIELLKSSGDATLAISGGKTPTPMFEDLAKSDLDWSRIHIFWVDERCVPPTDERSNFKEANQSLLIPAKVPLSNIHRIPGEIDPNEAAEKYVADINQFFSLKPGQLPVFDVLHRGMGPDAHTASLFPGEPLINNQSDIAAHVWVEKMKMDRITLLPGVLIAARHTVLQVTGTDKAASVHDVLYGPEDPLRYPCQIATRGSNKAVWFVDRAAAAQVENN
ncbi:MAG: 6-phosphogluconolactonase [Acidobacteriota bacterium]|nr:6-phosphogluconolactonase [Acidobacteriota bacterium]